MQKTFSGGFVVVGDLLMGDANVVKILQSLRGLAQGKSEIDMKGEAQGHDMGIVVTEFLEVHMLNV